MRMPLLLLLLLLASSGAQAKTVAIAVSGPPELLDDVSQAVRATKASPVDVTPVHARTHALVFDLNDSEPPSGWPQELAGVWRQGWAACTPLRTQPRFTMQDKGAWLCSRALAPALWQRFLDQRKPDVVLAVSASQASRPGEPERWSLEVVAYGPNETVQRTLSDEPRASGGGGLGGRRVLTSGAPEAPASGAPLAERVRTFVQRALKGDGHVAPRAVVRAFPTLSIPSADAKPQPPAQVKLKETVEIPEACRELPASLAVRAPTDELSAYFAGAFEAGIPVERRSGAALACDLLLLGPLSGGLLSGTRMKSFHYQLRCGGERILALQGLGISEPHARADLAPKLLKAIVNQACRP